MKGILSLRNWYLWEPNSFVFSQFVSDFLSHQSKILKTIEWLCRQYCVLLTNVEPGIHVVMRPRRRALWDCLLSAHAASSEILLLLLFYYSAHAASSEILLLLLLFYYSVHAASSEILSIFIEQDLPEGYWMRSLLYNRQTLQKGFNEIEIKRNQPAGVATGSFESKSWGQQAGRGDRRVWTSGR